MSCSQCLIKVASLEENCKFLVEQGIFQSINILQDSHDELLRYMTSIILAKLSYPAGQEDFLVMNGMLASLQYLIGHVHRSDSLCYLLLRYLKQPKYFSKYLIIFEINQLACVMLLLLFLGMKLSWLSDFASRYYY